jgi:hypothetical protein
MRQTIRRWQLHLRIDEAVDDGSHVESHAAWLDQLARQVLQFGVVPGLAPSQSHLDLVGEEIIQKVTRTTAPRGAWPGACCPRETSMFGHWQFWASSRRQDDGSRMSVALPCGSARSRRWDSAPRGSPRDFGGCHRCHDWPLKVVK